MVLFCVTRDQSEQGASNMRRPPGALLHDGSRGLGAKSETIKKKTKKQRSQWWIIVNMRNARNIS